MKFKILPLENRAYQFEDLPDFERKSMWVLIGRDGKLGFALYHHLKSTLKTIKIAGTSRYLRSKYYFDMKDPPDDLPLGEVVFIVAAKTKFTDCELHKDAWSINVDAPIRIAHHYSHHHAFVIYISSEAVEWSGHTAYGDQKRAAEAGIRAVVPYERLAIVRPDKLTEDGMFELCKLLEKIAKEKIGGVYRFRNLL